MPNQAEICDLVRQFIRIKGWSCTETDEGTTKRFDIQHAQTTGIAKVYSTGTLLIQGPTSELQYTLTKLKDLAENSLASSEIILLNEIKSSFVRVSQRIASIDSIVIQLINESIVCLESSSLAGSSILVGCASERAIWLLINSYTQAISNTDNRQRFKDKIKSQHVSGAYKTFKQSLRSSRNRREVDELVRDWETQIDALFHFYRICRNDIGHPIVPLSLERGPLIANLGRFARYIEVIYELIAYFRSHEVIL